MKNYQLALALSILLIITITSKNTYAQCAGADLDLDGFDACVDCDDGDSTINPDADELCGDGLDNNCNGSVDDTIFVVIGDGDGTPIPQAGGSVGPTQVTATVNKVATIADLDLRIDLNHTFMGDLEITLTGPNGATATIASNRGGGGSGYQQSSFDDEASLSVAQGVPPYAGSYIPETPLSVFDGGSTQGLWSLRILDIATGDAGSLGAWSLIFTSDGNADADGDGSPDCADCNDADISIYAGAPEVCDGYDNNCDGALPNDELDTDLDGYPSCKDCDDSDAEVSPDAIERCNGLDDDCDGTVPGNEVDNDGDGSSECEGDCHDADAGIAPGAQEVCDGLDNDCNGLVDDDGAPSGIVDSDADGVHEVCDLCPATNTPESVPLVYLKRGRWALGEDGDTQFDSPTCTNEHTGTNSFSSRSTHSDNCARIFSLADTAGCSCEQILDTVSSMWASTGSASSSDNQYRYGCKTKTLDAFIIAFVH